jgi:hypothetical protein
VDWAVGRVSDKTAGALKDRLNARGARSELATIIEDSIEAATNVAPALADDFRSETFLHHVLAPAVLQFLLDPTLGNPKERIVEGFVERFVEPFLRGRSSDETLVLIFRTKPDTLHSAIAQFLSTLRPALYASNHWAGRIRDQAQEEIRSTVLRIEKRLTSTDPLQPVDINVARSDAREGSAALCTWSRTIGGQKIERPELDQLLRRIREYPFATTLVIGEAGSGKSALFAEMTTKLQTQGMTVFAIKADLLPTSVRTLTDVSAALGMRGHLLHAIEALARVGPVVLLIDQLDAVSEVMDRSSERMRLLLQIVDYFRERKRDKQNAPPVHVLVSSRPFEADYDARFQSLEADVVKLSLPGYEQVEALLRSLAIVPEDIPSALRETVRRPFALKLVVDIFRRGVPVRDLLASELLNTWLASADLGEPAMRRETLAFLERLSSDMTENESLWRPADRYDVEAPYAVNAAIACGLVVRHDGQIGFSHQAWLDDFQAKAFHNGQELAEYAWDRQDGLFARATVLRALQRQRAFDGRAYTSSIDALLGTPRTRRHLRHLVVDLIAGQHEPTQREQAWVQQLARTDAALARRAFARITGQWANWRMPLRGLAGHVMNDTDLKWCAVQLLSAELAFDTDFVRDAIARHWDAAEHDLDVFQVYWRSAHWSPAAAERLRLVFQRQNISSHAVVDYATGLGDSRSAEVFQLFLDEWVFNKDAEHVGFHGLDELARRFPQAFARTLFAWFVRIASRATDGSPSLRDVYPRSEVLPHFWDDEHGRGGIFGTTKLSLVACAKEHPKEFLALIRPYLAVEVDEVQALIAEALSAGGEDLADESVEFLLADSRRLELGLADITDVDRVTRLIYGWSTQVLLEALAATASPEQLARIRSYIEAWDPYKDEAWKTDDAQTRLRRLRWADEKRLTLLSKLPPHLLEPRRRRQLQEWQSWQPVFGKSRRYRMMSAVKSPMSAAQMSRASDEDVFRLLDEVADNSERRPRTRRRNLDGGTIELGRAFAEFGKAHPERAFSIAERFFLPGRHENAAGELIRALAELEGTDLQRLLGLVRKWNADGFIGKGWRRDAAWAMTKMAERGAGLADDDIAMLESWIVDDAGCAAQRIEQRIALEEANKKNRKSEKVEPDAVVFRRGNGGMRILPQDNFTLLSAMCAGWLRRVSPDYDAWLAALERHVKRHEDPAIWTALLMFRGKPLYWADRTRSTRLLDEIWNRYPEAFSDESLGDYLWAYRSMVSDRLWTSILDMWLSKEEDRVRQAAGEILTAAVLVDGEDESAENRLKSILAGAPTPERLGALFAACAAWCEDDPVIRSKAHAMLLRFVGNADEDASHAIAIGHMLSFVDSLPGDALTKQMFESIAESQAVLKACLKRRFTHILQELLLNPGFEEVVLHISEKCADLMLADQQQSVRMPYGEGFVSIAITLQRSPDPLRGRAMDLYERLLDGAAYGAEEAAEASLSRT